MTWRCGCLLLGAAWMCAGCLCTPIGGCTYEDNEWRKVADAEVTRIYYEGKHLAVATTEPGGRKRTFRLRRPEYRECKRNIGLKKGATVTIEERSGGPCPPKRRLNCR